MMLPIRVDFIFFLTCKKTGTILPFCTSRRDTGTHLTKPGRIPENRDVWSPYHKYLSLSRPPISSSLKFCNRSFAYAAPALWNGLPKDLRQSVHPPNPPLNFTYPPLAICFATFHSRLKTELFKIFRFHS